jgi:hypothetical protein
MGHVRTFSSANFNFKVPIRTAWVEAERVCLYGAIRLALNKAFAKPQVVIVSNEMASSAKLNRSALLALPRLPHLSSVKFLHLLRRGRRLRGAILRFEEIRLRDSLGS